MRDYKTTMTKETILNFVKDLLDGLHENVDYDDVRDSSIEFIFDKRMISLDDYENDMTMEELEGLLSESPYAPIDQRVDAIGLVALWNCEGDLYERLYTYEGCGEDDEYGTAESIYKVMEKVADKHGIGFEWSGGCITLYDVEAVTKSLMRIMEESV